MPLDALWTWLGNLPISRAVSESTTLFPAVESIHVIAIALVVGTIAMMDLRLLNVASKDRAVSELGKEVLPWTWGCFAAAVITGGVMFLSDPHRYVANTPFQIKMGLLVLAGLNMALFHRIAYSQVHLWGGPSSPTPLGARAAGAMSLLFWVLIVTFGRWIGFV